MIVYMKKNEDDELVTKGYLNKRFSDFSKAMDMKFDVLKDQLKRELGDQINDKFNTIMNTLDKLLGEYTKFGQEHDILSHQQVRLSDKVENHEVRMKKLESKTSKIN